MAPEYDMPMHTDPENDLHKGVKRGRGLQLLWRAACGSEAAAPPKTKLQAATLPLMGTDYQNPFQPECGTHYLQAIIQYQVYQLSTTNHQLFATHYSLLACEIYAFYAKLNH